MKPSPAAIGFPSSSMVKNPPASAGDWGPIPGSGRSPGGGGGDREDPLEERVAPAPVFLPREYPGQSSLVGPHTVHGVPKSRT